MSLKGKNRHYRWSRIEPRHFFSTAQHVGFSRQRTLAIIQSILAQADAAMARVETSLPEHFPGAVSVPVMDGVGRQLKRLEEHLTL